MIDITEIISSFISLILAVLTAFIIPWIKSKIDLEKLDRAREWAEIFVTAAEQMYIGTGRGEEKFNYVADELAKKGIYLDPDEIEALIESKVFGINKEDRK